jgi:DNA-binding LytR/AlgR family response regulator
MMDWFLQNRAEKRSELIVRTSLGEETISVRDIRYIESRGHSCDIHLPQRTLSVRRSIDEMAELLDTAFYRCHKSFLLNFAHVAELEKNLFRMDDGSCVPISSARLSGCRTAYLTWKAGTP